MHTLATILATIGSIVTVYILSWLLYGLIGGEKTFTGFFIQNLVIFTVAAAITWYYKK